MTHAVGAILALLLTISSVTIGSAQIERGRSIVGGSAGFFLSKPEGFDASWQISLSPSVLYLVTDRLAIGGRLRAAVVRSGFRLDDEGITGVFAVAPAARYYFTADERGGLFATAAAGVAFTTIEGSGADLDLGLGVGYSLFLNEGLALEPAIRFDYLPGDFASISFSAAVGLQGFIDGFRLRGRGSAQDDD